jgi:hypothetical protein
MTPHPPTRLSIETFSNVRGGNAFFKAVTHPLAARAMQDLQAQIGRQPVAIFDRDGVAEGLAELHGLEGLNLAGCFAQDVTRIGQSIAGRPARPVTELPGCAARFVFIAAFDAQRTAEKLAPLMPAGAECLTLDAIRLPEALLSNRARYLDPMNFATNFVFFRDQGGCHTRLTTRNYWTAPGEGHGVGIWLLLYDADGNALAQWREDSAPDAAIILDSREIRARFGLPEFTGQLFCHAVGIAAHDAVKYALDTFEEGQPASLSCTHDANSWPAQFYAGLPAPAVNERVVLWLQNSQPCPIPAGAIALNLMGRNESRALDCEVAPYASVALDVSDLLPEARWPQQIEIDAGKFVVRPRYEVERQGKRRIAHVNVERTDLEPDPKLDGLGAFFGKGFLLPGPILPLENWRSLVLPTPMARSQAELPLVLIVYDSSGAEIVRAALGRIRRDESAAIDLDAVLAGRALSSGFGHFELIYDPAAHGGRDGWLHALFRYEERRSGHAADSSFGCHMFNTPLVYGDEPQSYSGRPPGLSTRLFLRLGDAPYDTLCHLIYPASTPWQPRSATDLLLCDREGTEVARRHVAIACSGSLFWRYRDMFGEHERHDAGAGASVMIRDPTCRLFGYHGLIGAEGTFSLDHMFGF